MAFIHHQYWPISPACPAKTTASNPVTTPWPITQGMLHGVKVMIPAGHNGLTGIKILYCGVQIIPWSLNFWLVGNNQTFDFSWGEEVMGTNLSIQTYNTDVAAHTWWLYADIEPTLGIAPAQVGGAPSLVGPDTSQLAQIAALTA